MVCPQACDPQSCNYTLFSCFRKYIRMQLRMISIGVTFNLLYSLKRPLANLNDYMKKLCKKTWNKSLSCWRLGFSRSKACLIALNFFLFVLGFVPRKREEENKRREAEQQKGRLSPDSCRPHAALCLPSTRAEPHSQSWAPSKQPPCSDKAQGPERKACRRSPGRGSPSRAPQKEQQLSSDLQRTEPRKPNGKCIALRFSANPWTVDSFVSYYLDHLHLR